MQGGLFADCQEWYSKVAKRSNKSSTILQHRRFVVAQESRFQASESSNAVLVGGRFDDIQKFCFQAAKDPDMTVPNCKEVYLLIVRYGIFRPRNVQI